MLLSTLLSEKGVHTPEPRVTMGGTLTHRLPTASDDRAGLTGSLNVISTLASQQITRLTLLSHKRIIQSTSKQPSYVA